MKTNAAKLYELIRKDPETTQALFRQALQDPQGALQAICDFGESVGLEVSKEEIESHLNSLDDGDTKQWLMKARGGL